MDKAVFFRAADILERDGWVQLQFEDSRGRRCALGAVVEANKESRCDITELIKFMVLQLPDYSSIMNWNDRPGRTAEEVVAKLRELAE